MGGEVAGGIGIGGCDDMEAMVPYTSTDVKWLERP